jgi:hypothetical protein
MHTPGTVPLEPTDEMVVAGVRVGCEQASHAQHCEEVYKAMISAFLDHEPQGRE